MSADNLENHMVIYEEEDYKEIYKIESDEDIWFDEDWVEDIDQC